VPDLVIQIVNILGPSMLLALIGLVWFYKGPTFPVDFVSTLVLNISTPALLFYTLATSVVPVSALGTMALATVLSQSLFALAAIGILRIAKKDFRLVVSYVVGNTGNLGLPVCFFAFGDEGLAFAMIFFSVQCLLLFSLGDAVHAGVIR
jgi:predicted permease